MFKIPNENKSFLQPNTGDTQGNIWSSFGIDLSKNKGRVNTGRSRLVQNIGIPATAGFTASVASAYAYYNIDGGSTQKFITYANGIISQDSPTISTNSYTSYGNDPTLNLTNAGNGDMKIFNGKLYVTTATEIKHKTGGSAWTTLSSGLTTDTPHPMTIYGDRLYVCDKNKVYSVTTSNVLSTTGSYTLDLTVFGGHISWIQAGNNRIWIGLTRNNGGKGLIFEWDGQSENLWSRNYIFDAQGTSACAIYGDIPYVMDIEGRLLAFNGGVFTEISRLPLLQSGRVSQRYNVQSGCKITHFNGMLFANDRLLINVDSSVTSDGSGAIGDYAENFPSGVWEYTKENGIVHLMSPSITEYSSSTLFDYGAGYTSQLVGAIFDTTVANTYPAIANLSNFVFSSRILNRTAGTIWGSFVDDVRNLERESFFITPFLDSSEVTSVFKNIVLKYKKIRNSTDKIKIKYRTVKENAKYINMSFVATNKLSVSVSSYPEIANVEIGDEVQVLSGYGAGQNTHILEIENVSGVYTITLSENLLQAQSGNNYTVQITNWREIKPVITKNNDQFSNVTLPLQNKDIHMQFKIVMQWTGNNELNQVMVVNSSEQYAK